MLNIGDIVGVKCSFDGFIYATIIATYSGDKTIYMVGWKPGELTWNNSYPRITLQTSNIPLDGYRFAANINEYEYYDWVNISSIIIKIFYKIKLPDTHTRMPTKDLTSWYLAIPLIIYLAIPITIFICMWLILSQLFG